ncbi:AAA family ATPase [Thiocapsa bogorovii]|uniref:AAA family ATPase n=1 Tax=Thiocapsa bogorovii TaxID=521689 RepID=UPI001E636BCF|nr:AAA family ATPase [Thiocapsa bogorovii]UHD18571.1 AAA family ATPase [Thiocapsa bogorovii]
MSAAIDMNRFPPEVADDETSFDDWAPDTDILTRTCPSCGASAEWPDCAACGHRFDGEAEVSSEPERAPYTPHIADEDEIPQELRALPVWVAWKLIQKPGKPKPDKAPVSPVTGRTDKWSNNPAFAGTFEQASHYAHTNKLHGIGVMLWPGCGFSAIDLDHCRDPHTGELSDMAREIMAEADSYTEVSPGLSGIRIIFAGTFGGHTGTDNPRGIELYEQKRFVTITGDHIEDSPFCIEKRDLTDLGRRYFPTKVQPAASEAPPIDFARIDINSVGLPRHALHVIRTGEASSYGNDRSKALFAVAKDLVKAGMDDDTIACVLCDPANGISEKALENRGGNLTSAMDWTRKYTVAAARMAVAQEAAQAGEQGNGSVSYVVKPPESKLRRVALSGFASARLSEPEYIINPYVPRRVLTLFGGHGGEGKSYVGLAMAAHVAVGRPWGPLEVTHGRVAFVSLEDDEEVVLYRLARIASVYGLDPARIEENLIVLDGTDADALVFERSDGGVKSVAPSHEGARVLEIVASERPDLLVIDNASDAFDAEENNRRQVRWFVKWLTRAVKPHRGAVLLLAHIDKASAKFGAKGNSYSGSTAWHNSARSRLALADGEIHHEKLNHAAKHSDPIRLRWDEGVPVPDSSSRGDIAGKGIIHQAEDAALLKCIGIAIANGDAIPTATQGSSTAWRTLEGYPEFTACFGTGDGKRRFKECLVRLSRAGRIRREMQETASRKLTERWVIVHQSEPSAPRSEAPPEDLAA